MSYKCRKCRFRDPNSKMGFQTYIFCSKVPSKCRKCCFRDPKFQIASHISHQQLSKFQQLDKRQQKKEPAMANEGVQISTLQVHQAWGEILHNNCNID